MKYRFDGKENLTSFEKGGGSSAKGHLSRRIYLEHKTQNKKPLSCRISMTEQEKKLPEFSGKILRELAKRVTDQFFLMQKNGSDNLAWDKFTEDFYIEQNQLFPNIFQRKEDLKKITFLIQAEDFSKNADNSRNIHCGDWFIPAWKFYFSVAFSGKFKSVTFDGVRFLGICRV